MKLAVYGTLRSFDGVNNDSWGGALSSQKLLGKALLPEGYAIFNLGSFPAVKQVDTPLSNRTVVEVYEIDEVALSRCDQIEGYAGPDCDNFYDRVTVDIEGHGECYLYTLHDADLSPQIFSGDWFERG